MTTIAQHYENIGEARGEARGIARGEARGIAKTATRMLKENADIEFVARVTGISRRRLLALQNSF